MGARALENTIQLAKVPGRIYRGAPDDVRRIINPAFNHYFLCDDDGRVQGVRLEPFDELAAADRQFIEINAPERHLGADTKKPRAGESDAGSEHPTLSDLFSVSGWNKPLMVVLTEYLSRFVKTLERLVTDDSGSIEAKERPAPPRQRQRRFTPVEAADVAARYQAGASMNDLARDLQVHKRTIASCLSRQGVPTRTVGLADEHIPAAAELYQAGWSLARIGEHYGTTDMTIRHALGKHGVQIRPRRGFEQVASPALVAETP